VNAVEDPTTERPAQPGELCTCGRQARTVFLTRRWGEVGSCNTDNTGQRPILPCPFCRATEAHEVGGEIVKCPQYQLRGLDDLTDPEPRRVLDVRHAERVDAADVVIGDYVSTAPEDLIGKAVFHRVRTVGAGSIEFESVVGLRASVVYPPGSFVWRWRFPAEASESGVAEMSS